LDAGIKLPVPARAGNPLKQGLPGKENILNQVAGSASLKHSMKKYYSNYKPMSFRRIKFRRW
jgi:hypothetical protein